MSEKLPNIFLNDIITVVYYLLTSSICQLPHGLSISRHAQLQELD